jgi:hypothetical protein
MLAMCDLPGIKSFSEDRKLKKTHDLGISSADLGMTKFE